MDLGLHGRTVFFSGLDDGMRSACNSVLGGEGMTCISEPHGADVVVAAGGRRPGSDLLALDDVADLYDAWRDATEAIEAYRSALPHMTAGRWGRLVWIGTAQAKSVDAERDELAAVVSLGMLGLHKVLTAEAGPNAVTSNAVLRGGLATDDDVAAAVAFLCSEGAAYLSGITIAVDGGVGSAVF
jgi:NAD(P)-dependent dehydrogenase (short-subunit alcohol dehydrogenase family)